jgi:hypothetical protein
MVERVLFKTAIHSCAYSIKWFGLMYLAHKPAASRRHDEDSSAMDDDASRNHFPSLRSHSLVGASTPALGSPYFQQLEIMVSDMPVYMRLPLHCKRLFAHLTYGG